jgi:hypothetical protein
MADAGSSGDVAKAIGHLMMAALGGVLPWLTAGSTTGPALTTLFSILGGICALVFSLLYRRYLGVLSAVARRRGTAARQAYDALRESLTGGNLAARLYARWLQRFLDAIDRFFGDAGMADRTLFPHAFGLQKPAPLWTAPAFDRCLLLALIYPIATILVIWAVSGHDRSGGGRAGPQAGDFRLGEEHFGGGYRAYRLRNFAQRPNGEMEILGLGRFRFRWRCR